MTIANNIAAFREAKGWARPELAKRMDTTPQQVERLEKGQRGLTTDWIEKAARALGVPVGDIITPGAAGPATGGGEDYYPAPDILPTRNASADDGTAEIISLNLALSMGPGTLIEEMIEEETVRWDIGLLRSLTRTPFQHIRQVRGVGDSMEPTLRTADRILIDTSERTLTRMHGIYWIDHFGAHGLKRLRAAGQGRIVISSDNKVAGGPDFEVDADELRIHGRAIGTWREL